jgi:hypothetical protein
MKRFEHGPIVEEDSIFAADAVLAELGLTQAEPVAKLREALRQRKAAPTTGEFDYWTGEVFKAAVEVAEAAPQPQPQPQASAEDIAKVERCIENHVDVIDAREEWQNIRADYERMGVVK